jgi:hypothetical protein
MILDEVLKLYPNLNGVRVALNSCSEEARELAIKLFEAGAVVIVADKNPQEVTLLNRVLRERSYSLYRYHAVSFSTLFMEAADVFVAFEEQKPKELEHGRAKHRIDVRELREQLDRDAKAKQEAAANKAPTPVKPAAANPIPAAVKPASTNAPAVPAAATVKPAK